MKYLVIFALLTVTAYAQDVEYPPTLIGFVELGEYFNPDGGVMVGESKHFLLGETIVWYFNAIYSAGEDTLSLCFYNFELKRYTKKRKILVSEAGALGRTQPDPGLWRLDILNSRGEVLAMSKYFEVKDVKDL